MFKSIYLLLIVYLTTVRLSYTIFSIQQSLTILCNQFPFINHDNNSDLQCARLRKNDNVPITTVDLDKPSEIILFIIVDQTSISATPLNIQINFNQSNDLPSSINEIHISLLVTHTTFIINNQTDTIYAPYDLLIFHWRISTENTYELIDHFQLENHDFENDNSLCQWTMDRWNRLFYANLSMNVSYVYFLKTTKSQLLYTLIDTSNKSLDLIAPTPFLNILYCIPYRLGTTEIVLIVCFGFVFIVVVIILLILHLFKGGEDKRTVHVHQYHQQDTQNKSSKTLTQQTRHHSNESMSHSQYADQNDD
uniref:Uncharacterized protein n=1 Tax=Adineta vaga TaxID=104782 RepID=B3VZZ9_ADIVA|nr:hypothetical protein [Adineta vaga]